MLGLVFHVFENFWPLFVVLAGVGIFARVSHSWFGWVFWLVVSLSAWLFLFAMFGWKLPKELFAVVATVSLLSLILIDLAAGVGAFLRQPAVARLIVFGVLISGVVLFLARQPEIRNQVFVIAIMFLGIAVMFKGFFPRNRR